MYTPVYSTVQYVYCGGCLAFLDLITYIIDTYIYDRYLCTRRENVTVKYCTIFVLRSVLSLFAVFCTKCSPDHVRYPVKNAQVNIEYLTYPHHAAIGVHFMYSCLEKNISRWGVLTTIRALRDVMTARRACSLFSPVLIPHSRVIVFSGLI